MTWRRIAPCKRLTAPRHVRRKFLIEGRAERAWSDRSGRRRLLPGSLRFSEQSQALIRFHFLAGVVRLQKNG